MGDETASGAFPYAVGDFVFSKLRVRISHSRVRGGKDCFVMAYLVAWSAVPVPRFE